MNLDKLIHRLLDTRQDSSRVRMGVVPSDHAGGNPRVLGDGETEASPIGYPVIHPYTPLSPPAAGDRVMMQKQGRNWVVAGKVADLGD